MSLLLDALKRAERQKRFESTAEDAVLPESGDAAKIGAPLPSESISQSSPSLPVLELADVGADVLLKPERGAEGGAASVVVDFPSLSFSLEPMAVGEQSGVCVPPALEVVEETQSSASTELFPSLSVAVTDEPVIASVALPEVLDLPESVLNQAPVLDVLESLTSLPVLAPDMAQPFAKAPASVEPIAESAGLVLPIADTPSLVLPPEPDPLPTEQIAQPPAENDLVAPVEPLVEVVAPVLVDAVAKVEEIAPVKAESISQPTDAEKRERAERIKQSWSAAMSPTRKRRLVLVGVVMVSALASVAALFVMNPHGLGGALPIANPVAEASTMLAEAGELAKQAAAASNLPTPTASVGEVGASPIGRPVAEPIVAVPGMPTAPIMAAPMQNKVPEPVVSTVTQVPVAPRLPPPAQEPAIQRDQIVVRVHPATEAGFKAMNSGEVEAARQHYREALRSDQTNRDALLGLAVAALREGRPDEAASWYERMLMLDPRDTDATAGLALVRGQLDPVAYEGRLRNLLLERGETASLHYSLGILLARQNRWGEAQESFFRAITLAPASPDYHFNLAVALDHLSQYKQAAIYYQKALSLASGIQHPGFSVSAARQRIAAISSM